MALKEGYLITATVECKEGMSRDLVGVYRGLDSISWTTYFTLEIIDEKLGNVIAMHPLDDVVRITYCPDDDDDDTKQDEVPF